MDAEGPGPDWPACCSVGVFRGREAAVEEGASAPRPALLLWLLQETPRFHPGVGVASRGLRAVSFLQIIREGEEVEPGVTDADGKSGESVDGRAAGPGAPVLAWLLEPLVAVGSRGV